MLIREFQNTFFKLASAAMLLTIFGSSAFSAQQQSFLSQFNQNDDTNKQKSAYKIAKRIAKQEKDDTKKIEVKPKSGAAKLPQNVSAARQKEILAFCDKHHKELLPLLATLRKNRSGQYQTVLRSLDREVRSLQSQEKRSPDRYPKYLEIWTVRSKVRLLTAHMAMKRTPEQRAKVKKQLGVLVAKEYDLKTEQLRADYVASKKRTERVKGQLDAIESNRKELIAKSLEKLDNSARRIISQSQKAKEAKKKPVENKKNADKKTSDKKKSAEPAPGNPRNDQKQSDSKKNEDKKK
jgi:hypothetical protein